MTAYLHPAFVNSTAMALTLASLRVTTCKQEIQKEREVTAAAIKTEDCFSPQQMHVEEANNSQGVVGDGSSSSILDNSLTSLGWLQNLRVLDLFSPDVVSLPIVPPSPCSDDGLSWETVSSSSPEDRAKRSEAGISLSPIRRCLTQSSEFRKFPKKYRSKLEKPPFSFSTLIYLAIQHKSGRASLSEIYRWIKTNFKYYRMADQSWQNSVRHNLSLNEMFVKVPRDRTSSNERRTKGNFWIINPEYEHLLLDENTTQLCYSDLKEKAKLRKRSHSQSCCCDKREGRGTSRKSGSSRLKKRTKSESATPADPCGLPGDLNWVSLLSSQKVSCVSCPSQTCRPAFGSPVLGPPDLGHIGEPVVCSPLIIPTTLSSEQAEIPVTPTLGENKGALLEEALLQQDSPSPQLLPWAESHSQSPASHPWAETKEVTLHEVRKTQTYYYPGSRTNKNFWSPESSLSSSTSSARSSNVYRKRTPLLSEACLL